MLENIFIYFVFGGSFCLILFLIYFLLKPIIAIMNYFIEMLEFKDGLYFLLGLMFIFAIGFIITNIYIYFGGEIYL